jgi:hypothetical protein
MINLFEKSWKKIITVIIAIAFLSTPGIVGFATANASGLVSENVILAAQKVQQNCPSCKTLANSKAVEFAKKNMGLSANLISGDEEQQYLSRFKSYKGLDDLNDKLLVYKVVRVEPVNYIYVSGTFKQSNDTFLYAVINGNTNEIAMLKTVKYDGVDTVNVTNYLHNGATASVTLEGISKSNEQQAQNMDGFMNEYSSSTAIQQIMPDVNWQKWCCSFAGLLACSLGCAVFIEVPPGEAACEMFCVYFWDNGLC